MNMIRSQSLSLKLQPFIVSKYHSNKSKVQQMQQTQPCPEITSSYSINKQQPRKKEQKIYIHHLQIDYGKLSMPSNQIQTKNYQEAIFNSISMNMTTKVQKSNRQQHLQTKRISKKGPLVEKHSLNEKLTQKKKLKMKTLLLKPPTQKSQNSVNLSTLSNISSIKNSLQEDSLSNLKSQKENKKVSKQSRLVKMMVGSGMKKTRLICYPDTSEYKKLCNLS